MDKGQNREAAGQLLDTGRLIRLLMSGSVYAIGGYLSGLAALPFGAAPFGIALLAAADKRALFVYIGLALSCLFGADSARSLTALGMYTVLLLLRVLVRLTLDTPFSGGGRRSLRELFGSLFTEAFAYRMLSAAVCALGLGACYLFGGGILYYDLFGLLISTAIAPAAAYVFYGFFNGKGIARDLGFLAICAACVWGCAGISFYGISPAVLGGFLVTFLVTDRRGMGAGAVTGLVLGLVYSPILAPAYVISAVCVGIFVRISPPLAAFSAFAASVAWGFYAKGIYALDGFFAGTLSACVLYTVIRRVVASDKKREAASVGNCRILADSELDSVRLFDMNRRMSAMAEGLRSLSGFFELLRSRAPDEAELARICRDAFESSCFGCSSYEECRERVYIDGEAERLAALLRKKRAVCSRDLDAELSRRCQRLPDIIDEINYNSGIREAVDECGERQEDNYEAISRLLEKSMGSEGEEYVSHPELSEAAKTALESFALEDAGVIVYGGRRKTVYLRAKDPEAIKGSKSRLLEALSAAMPFSLDVDSAELRSGGDHGALTVSEGDRLSVSYTSRQLRAREEPCFCGDSMAVFKNRDNRFFSLISDGMGSGREAATVSEICAGFLGRMLTVGGMNRELLEMLNGALCGRGEGRESECSATVDLMELDLISGRTVFYKSGAAPTYVYRDGNLFKLRSRTMPIGILKDADTKELEMTLSAGDVVVMVSDGATGGGDECPWLFDLLRQNIDSEGLERTADLIVKYAVGHGSEDDISVVIMRVEECS